MFDQAGRRKGMKSSLTFRVDKNENFTSYVKKLFRIFYEKIIRGFSRQFFALHFKTQAMLVLTPLMIIIAILLTLTHYQFYKINFIQDYLTFYGSQVVVPYIESLDNFKAELENEIVIQDGDDKFNPLLFYKIYIKELSRNSFLENNVMTNIGNSFNLFSGLNQPEFLGDLNFEIKKEDLINYMDEINPEKHTQSNKSQLSSNINLNNFLKLFYLFTPLYIQKENIERNFLSSIYIIAYQANSTENSGIYFQFPIESDYVHSKGVNFSPYDTFNDPVPEFLNPNENFTNWFKTKDQDFLRSSNLIGRTDLVHSISFDLYINKWEYIFSLIQFKMQVEDKTIIVEIISKYYKDSSRISENTKFSFLNLEENYEKLMEFETNTNYIEGPSVISNLKTFPLQTSAIYDTYFSEGMLSTDPSLNFQGFNLDSLDFRYFSILEYRYDINRIFLYDVNIFKLIFLYNSFFIKIREMINSREQFALSPIENNRTDDLKINGNSSYITRFNDDKLEDADSPQYNDQIFLKIAPKDSHIVKEVCSQIDFFYFYYIIQDFSYVDCFDLFQVQRYNSYNQSSYSNVFEDYGLERINCNCVILFCLRMNNQTIVDNFLSDYANSSAYFLNEDFDYYAKEITLPAKCSLTLLRYVRSESQTKDRNLLYEEANFDIQFFAQTYTNVDPRRSLLNILVKPSNRWGQIMSEMNNYLNYILSYIYIIYSVLIILFILFMICQNSSKLNYFHEFIEEKDKLTYVKISEIKKVAKINKESEKPNDYLRRKRSNIFVVRDSKQFKEGQTDLSPPLKKLGSINEVNEGNSSESDSSNIFSSKNRKIYKKMTQSNFKNIKVDYFQTEDNKNDEEKENFQVSNFITGGELKNEKEMFKEESIKKNKFSYFRSNTAKDINKLPNLDDGVFSINDSNEENEKDNKKNRAEILLESLQRTRVFNENEHELNEIREKEHEINEIRKLPESNEMKLPNLFDPNKNHVNNEDLITIPSQDSKLDVNENQTAQMIQEEKKKNSKLNKTLKTLHTFYNRFTFQKTYNELNSLIASHKEEDELKQIFNLVESNLDLFQLDFDNDMNNLQSHKIISYFLKINEKYSRMANLFDSSLLDLEMDFSLRNELTKYVLYEVVSTEFFDINELSFNFRFKYKDNVEEDSFLLKKLFATPSNQRRHSSFIVNIYNVKAKLKLLEKTTIFDFINEDLEQNLNTEEDNEYKIIQISNLKSIVNYYLENIHLPWFHCIYENQFLEIIDNI